MLGGGDRWPCRDRSSSSELRLGTDRRGRDRERCVGKEEGKQEDGERWPLEGGKEKSDNTAAGIRMNKIQTLPSLPPSLLLLTA